MSDFTELTQSEINGALSHLKQLSEYPTPSTQFARIISQYISNMVEVKKKANSVISAVVTAARIRRVRPFDGDE